MKQRKFNYLKFLDCYKITQETQIHIYRLNYSRLRPQAVPLFYSVTTIN
jgi:hypothetical protein